MTGGNIQELYQELILEHNRHPRNFYAMTDASRSIVADNPICGDRLQLNLKVEANRITDISFEGSGCAISMASVSMLTERVKGKTVEEAKKIFAAVHSLLTGEPPSESQIALGDLEVLRGVCNYPMRIKCASLSWHALNAALEEEQSRIITTE